MLNNARWITAPVDMGVAACSFKKKVALRGEILSAVLYVSSIGVYAAYINGQRVGDAVLTPGFTSYNKRVLYQEYDLTALLESENVIDISVGQGWAVGYIGYGHTNNVYADHTSVIARIVVKYADGKEENIVTDESWSVYTHPVLMTDIYNGETHDATHIPSLVGNAVYSDVDTALVAQDGEWIREKERLSAIDIIRTPNGETVIDFGQNMTGYAEIKAHGKRGERIVIDHAEVLDKDGNFYIENMRVAKNENTYVLSGNEEIFKPIFTFQGFRYIRLKEYPDYEVRLEDFTAVAVYSDMKRTGYFSCGNEKINQLYHNVIWGQRSNFLDIPTDCPQRDERLGWTGDAQVFCRTACINYDTKKFFTKWLADMALDQGEDGSVNGVIPIVRKNRNSSAWGDAATIIPWELYVVYGDIDLLKTHFPMMKKWVDFIHSQGSEEYLWLEGDHYGDWLAMDNGDDSYSGATSKDFIATAFFAHSASLVVRAGHALGEDVSHYEELYSRVKAAFKERFTENGMPTSMTQTAITLMLKFNLCEETERPVLVKKLVSMIRENRNKMTTGFVGTPYILHVLSENGEVELAYELLAQEENPSWLYSVCHGATTMWEHWNGIKEDGSFWSADMNSFNHYAYGSVYDWIFGVAVGIKPDEVSVGYRKVNVAPHPSKVLGYADASIDTAYGKIRTHWYYKGERVYYEIEIPDGVTAHLELPDGRCFELERGSYHFA